VAKVEVTRSLEEKVHKTFRSESVQVFQHMKLLEKNPSKGKLLGTVGGIIIKELKFKNFRFYFITDGFKIKCLRSEDLTDLLIMFIRMSDKKHQQKTINEIKHILRTIGPSYFEKE